MTCYCTSKFQVQRTVIFTLSESLYSTVYSTILLQAERSFCNLRNTSRLPGIILSRAHPLINAPPKARRPCRFNVSNSNNIVFPKAPCQSPTSTSPLGAAYHIYHLKNNHILEKKQEVNKIKRYIFTDSMIDNEKRLKSEVKQWSDKKNIRKTKSSKMTPCKAIKILLKPNPIKQCNDLLTLARMRSDHKTNSTAIFQRIVFLLHENPNIIQLVNSTDGYNALHHVCSNPTLVMNIKVVKTLVNASEKFIKETNDDEEMIAEKDRMLFKKSGIAQILRQKTSVYGDLPLHLLCKTASLASLDVFEYLVQSYPGAVCIQDKLSLNLPLHNICKACTEEPVPLESVLLLVQSWPKSCQVRNRDGNLPIHLAASVVKHRSRENLPKMFGSDGNESEFDIYNENELSMKTDSTSSMFSYENNNQTSEDYELSRFEKQLEILQYLVSLYPEGLDIKNNHGLAPVEIALLTSSDSFSYPESINDRWECKTSDSKSKHKLIIDFLRQDTSCSDTASFSTTSNNDSISSHQKKGSIFEKFNNSGIIDTSGHEFDIEDDVDETPWVDRGYEEAGPDDKREGLSGPGYQHESMAKRRGSTDMFVVKDRDNGLGSSSYHSGVSTNRPSKKLGRRGSIGKSTESDKRGALTSTSYHRESKPRLLGTTMARRGSVEHYCPFNTWSETCTKVASSEWQNNEDDDNLSCALQALDEFSEQDDSIEIDRAKNDRVPKKYSRRRHGLRKQNTQESLRSVSSPKSIVKVGSWLTISEGASSRNPHNHVGEC